MLRGRSPWPDGGWPASVSTSAIASPELVPERDLPSDVYRSVAYDRVCVYLINALKEVKQRLEDLEGGE